MTNQEKIKQINLLIDDFVKDSKNWNNPDNPFYRGEAFAYNEILKIINGTKITLNGKNYQRTT